MRTIYKYALSAQEQTLATYDGARFLAVGNQLGQVVVWAEVDTDRPPANVKVHCLATGAAVPQGIDYVGSVQVATASLTLVWHVYADRRQP